jgi:quinol monooxygenase YgiN
MAVIVVAELPAQPDKTDELVEFIRSIIPGTREFDGFEGISMHRDADDPNHVALVEVWASRAHHEKYLAWRTERGDFGQVVAMLAGPPSIRYFDPIEI